MIDNDESTLIETEQSESLSENTDEIINSLKSENVKWRLRAKENKDAIKKHEASERRLKELEEKSNLAMQQVTSLKNMADKRLLDAEIKSIATELGLKKMEYSKLADLSQVKILDGGDITGVKESLLSLKASDPELFKMATTTNTDFSASQVKNEPAPSDLKGITDINEMRKYLRQKNR